MRIMIHNIYDAHLRIDTKRNTKHEPEYNYTIHTHNSIKFTYLNVKYLYNRPAY